MWTTSMSGSRERLDGLVRVVSAIAHEAAADGGLQALDAVNRTEGIDGRGLGVLPHAVRAEIVGREVVVIGGEVTMCTDDVLSQIRSVVYQQAQPLATRNLSIVHTEFGAEAGLIGGMVSAIEQVLSPRGIQYHTRPPGSDMKPLGKS